MNMNTTIRYWTPYTQQCRYQSFKTYKEALNMIEFYLSCGVKAEVKVH